MSPGHDKSVCLFCFFCSFLSGVISCSSWKTKLSSHTKLRTWVHNETLTAILRSLSTSISCPGKAPNLALYMVPCPKLLTSHLFTCPHGTCSSSRVQRRVHFRRHPLSCFLKSPAAIIFSVAPPLRQVNLSYPLPLVVACRPETNQTLHHLALSLGPYSELFRTPPPIAAKLSIASFAVSYAKLFNWQSATETAVAKSQRLSQLIHRSLIKTFSKY